MALVMGNDPAHEQAATRPGFLPGFDGGEERGMKTDE